VRVAWRLLRSMATTLFDLYGTGVDLEREFSNRTGFELALTESGATKAGAEIYRQRLVRHADRIIYAGGHVKFGNRAPRLLRVHFAFPPDSPRLLVTHCGDHLETAGSRRRS